MGTRQRSSGQYGGMLLSGSVIPFLPSLQKQAIENQVIRGPLRCCQSSSKFRAAELMQYRMPVG
jgi:hypothetical protein